MEGHERLLIRLEISALTACPLHVDESDPSHTVTAPPTTSVVSNPLRIETSTHNGVTIYGTGETACRLSAVVDEFDRWGEKPGFAEVPEDRRMAIPLKEGRDERIPKSTVYPQGPKERELIDQIFDRLHQQGRMEWSLHLPQATILCSLHTDTFLEPSAEYTLTKGICTQSSPN